MVKPKSISITPSSNKLDLLVNNITNPNNTAAIGIIIIGTLPIFPPIFT